MDPSNLPAAAMSFIIEKESIVCQLYHKTKHNNSMNVVCELSEKIGSPQWENDEWVVPTEITGLNAKKAKVFKIRFHPSVSKMSSSDAVFHQSACQSAIKHLDLLLEESSWTRRSNQNDHLFGKQINKIADILSDMDKVVEIDNNNVFLSFLRNESFDELLKLISCRSVAAHLHTLIVDDGSQQSVDLVFEKEGKSRKLISLLLDSGYLKESESGQECVFDSSKSCFTWVLTRSDDDLENSPPNVTQKLDCYMWIDGKQQEMPVYSPCASVFHNLDKLSTSLNAMSPSCNGVLQRVTQALAVDAIVGLDKSEASHLQRFIQNITHVPLLVDTDFESDSLDAYSDPEGKHTISPTDSVDSGVSLSSPTRQSSFDDEDGDDEDSTYSTSPGFRVRSRSESCSSLKGILKWPSRRPSMLSRLATKPHLIRSYSECHHDDDKYSMLMPLRFSEDDEDAFHEEEEDSSSDYGVSPAAPRKKSVSFSEKIEQTRLFNSNSSIASQKRKNLKKNEKKKKRENSLASSIESIHEEAGRISPSTQRQTV